jgi:uncharacterized protein (DUF952 family)
MDFKFRSPHFKVGTTCRPPGAAIPSPAMQDTVYKICGREEWEAAAAAGSYMGNTDDLRDGFIHLSAEDQVAGTLEKHFAGRTDLLLVAIAAAHLGSALRWEPSRGGALFPHLYGALPLSSVVDVSAIGGTDQ